MQSKLIRTASIASVTLPGKYGAHKYAVSLKMT